MAQEEKEPKFQAKIEGGKTIYLCGPDNWCPKDQASCKFETCVEGQECQKCKLENSGAVFTPPIKGEPDYSNTYNMLDIEKNARKLAVSWGDNMRDDFINQKVKLASDIMNYAKWYAENIPSNRVEEKEAWISVENPPEVAYNTEKNNFIGKVVYIDIPQTIPVAYKNGEWYFHNSEELINDQDIKITHYMHYPE